LRHRALLQNLLACVFPFLSMMEVGERFFV
jgi:hypothetical protein